MKPVKVNDVLRCDKCGVELKVVKDCDATCACSIVCCGQPMNVKAAATETAKRPCCG
jgi:hypothetical protein